MFGGSACPDDLGDMLVNAGVNLVAHYGATEVGQLMTSNRPPGDKEWNWLRPPEALLPFPALDQARRRLRVRDRRWVEEQGRLQPAGRQLRHARPVRAPPHQDRSLQGTWAGSTTGSRWSTARRSTRCSSSTPCRPIPTSRRRWCSAPGRSRQGSSSYRPRATTTSPRTSSSTWCSRRSTPPTPGRVVRQDRIASTSGCCAPRPSTIAPRPTRAP